MRSRLGLPVLLGAVLLLGAYGCGDEEGGCGPAPQKKEEQAAPAAPGGAPHGGAGAAAELITQDKKGRVPAAYQRPGTRDEDGEKSDRAISKPQISKSTEAASSSSRVEVLARKVGGVPDRVKLACTVKVVSKDGKCMTAKNYLEIKERCCPDGLVESCAKTADGVLIVGRGCEPAP